MQNEEIIHVYNPIFFSSESSLAYLINKNIIRTIKLCIDCNTLTNHLRSDKSKKYGLIYKCTNCQKRRKLFL